MKCSDEPLSSKRIWIARFLTKMATVTGASVGAWVSGWVVRYRRRCQRIQNETGIYETDMFAHNAKIQECMRRSGEDVRHYEHRDVCM